MRVLEHMIWASISNMIFSSSSVLNPSSDRLQYWIIHYCAGKQLAAVMTLYAVMMKPEQRNEYVLSSKYVPILTIQGNRSIEYGFPPWIRSKSPADIPQSTHKNTSNWIRESMNILSYLSVHNTFTSMYIRVLLETLSIGVNRASTEKVNTIHAMIHTA